MKNEALREMKHNSFLLPPPSRFSRVRLCVTLWTAAHQAPLPTGFSRQEHWSGLPFPSPNSFLISTLKKKDIHVGSQGDNCCAEKN